MRNLVERERALRELGRERILILDGGMGTLLQQQDLAAADFGGVKFEGCNEYLALTRPDLILPLHRDYLAAGADIIKTNSFGATPIVLAEYGLADRAQELNRRAAELARSAADEYATAGQPRFVAGSMGPTTKSISVTGGITFRELRANFLEQARGLIEGGADLLLLETCHDTRNAKAGILAIEDLSREIGQSIPVMLSVTIEASGTMLAGQSIEALCVSLAHVGAVSLGLNCATGPEFMTDHLRALQSLTPTFVSCYPNAGIPDDEARYPETPESLARQLERFIDRGWINIAGGCCGTTPRHIAAIAKMARGKAPRRLPEPSHRVVFSGIEVIEADETTRPLIVGERTNAIGSRLFRNLIAEERWEDAVEIGRRQVKNGAQIIDICLQSADRDELRDIPPFYERLVRAVKAPLMIDTTDPRALELALAYSQGKSIINSINLEDGEEKFKRVCPLARSYGAALVVGCIDEDPAQAQAFTRERKLAIARRSRVLLIEKFGIPAENIIHDPLVFPCATGDENYIGAAVETIEALRLLKADNPRACTILGISNVSFGLPAGAREVVNSVFLYHCTKAGLDLAIVNAERIERFSSIPETERRLAEDLLFNRPPREVPCEHPQAALLQSPPEDWRLQTREQKIAVNQYHIAAITDHFRSAAKRTTQPDKEVPLDQLLANHILEGSKAGLIENLDRKLSEGAAPIGIINGPLMAGMREVGRRFNNNELIVAEVLQSAEVMKAAVDHLEKFMDKATGYAHVKVILATVKGDVHDIGKNLVEILLKNNGFDVVNLGIKVPPDELVSACRKHQPDAIGLSGLLVKSAQQMAVTAGDLRAAGIRVPLLVGGAALSERFARQKIAPQYDGGVYYAKDAMTGLRILNELATAGGISRRAAATTKFPSSQEHERLAAFSAPASTLRASSVRTDLPIPDAPGLDRRVLRITDLREIWTYVNSFMLYGRHLGFRGNFERALSLRDPRALELLHKVEQIKREASSFMQAAAVWQFFEAERDGNSIALFSPKACSPLLTFHFRRQSGPAALCLSDYVLPPRDGRRDHIALFVVTAGAGVREQSARATAQGRYLFSHGLQALALESAEACAEWLHRHIREEWGFPDSPSLSMAERFRARYRGKRYSFGYPACPDLDNQSAIFALLKPEEIGVTLTEEMMMDPEASVSATVFHHPDCAYFSVGESPARP